MNVREIKRLAYRRCAALIRVNAGFEDSDLTFMGDQPLTDAEYALYLEACFSIADSLARRAEGGQAIAHGNR